ncbi:hypothetical protein ACX0G9_12910 [Flavitalea flava]
MPNHLYTDLKPGDRISRLFQEFIAVPLAPEGYIFSKSLRSIRKKGDFFENHIDWYTRKYNSGQPAKISLTNSKIWIRRLKPLNNNL